MVNKLVFEGFTHLNTRFTTMNITEQTTLEDDTHDFSKAKKNLEELEQCLKSELENYESSDVFDQDEEKLRYILECDKKVQLTDSGGLFIEFDLDDALTMYDGSEYSVFTNSEIPNHLIIHNIAFNTKKGIVRIQLTVREALRT